MMVNEMMHHPLFTRRNVLRTGGAIVAGALAGCASIHAPRPRRVFDAHDFGAIGDGVNLDTQAIQRAIDEASASGTNAQVLLRGGKTYRVGSIALRGGIDLHLADDARILISPREEDYSIVSLPRVAASQPAAAPRNDRPVFTANGARGLSISGTGTIDGQWREFMEEFDPENQWWRTKPFRPPMFQLIGCSDLQIRDIHIEGSSIWTLHMLGCQRVLVDNLTIDNPLDVPNCDGINPDHSKDVVIRNCRITCGDDAIAIKTSRFGAQFGAARNIRVTDCVLKTQDAGMKIGTETVQDVHDIRFERCTVIQGSRGICIQLRDAGSVYDVEFRDITFTARYFAAPWWGRGEGISLTAFPRTAQTQIGRMHDIRMRNVAGRCENSIRIDGSESSRIGDVLMENVSVTLDRWTPYPGGAFDNRPREQNAIETHANPAIHVRNADNVTIRNCRVAWGTGRRDDFTHAIQGENVSGLNIEKFAGESAQPDRYKAISINEP
jgi:polygalacturonase